MFCEFFCCFVILFYLLEFLVSFVKYGVGLFVQFVWGENFDVIVDYFDYCVWVVFGFLKFVCQVVDGFGFGFLDFDFFVFGNVVVF